jgi:fatty acid desaturase
LLRHPEDRLPLLLILTLFAVDLAVWWFVRSPWLVAAWALASLLPKAGVCAFNHHHQHISTFTSPVPNRLIELVFALQTGVTSQAWVLHHSLGHHLNYLDQTKDESRWAREDGSRMGEWEYTWITTLTAYPRAWAVGAKYPKIRRLFLLMGIATVALVAGLVALRPLAGALIFVAAPLAMLAGTALATWAHHSDRSTEDHMTASNNILQPFYNWLTCNLGYHTAHHYKPGVHWSQLPALHAQIAGKIPAEAYVEAGLLWRWFGAAPQPEQQQALEIAQR